MDSSLGQEPYAPVGGLGERDGSAALPGARFATYHSQNAPHGETWLTFIWTDGERLPVTWKGLTEEVSLAAAQAYWAGILEKQGADMARRAELSRAAKARATAKAAANKEAPND